MLLHAQSRTTLRWAGAVKENSFSPEAVEKVEKKKKTGGAIS